MFQFRLQRLLDLRRRLREEAERKLAVVQREHENLTAQIEALRRTRAEHLDVLAGRKAEGVQVRELLLYDEYLTANLLNIDATTTRRRLVGQEVEEKRRQVVEAMRREKTVEKLRERAWQRYVARQWRVERDLLDESATARYIRRLRHAPEAHVPVRVSREKSAPEVRRHETYLTRGGSGL